MSNRIERGILLSGGSGSRMYPMNFISKQLHTVFDKPMVYYPLSTLVRCGIGNILLISTPQDIDKFESLLGNGQRLGIEISYAVQPEPKGIAQAITIADDHRHLENRAFALILGDNMFSGADEIFQRAFADFPDEGARIFAYAVGNPKRYGVVEFDEDGLATSLIEKPEEPRTNLAVPGFYLYPGHAVKVARELKPSGRGEYEITDVNKHFMDRRMLEVFEIPEGCAWLDAGTHESLNDAGNYVRTIRDRQNTNVGCIEEAAHRAGFINERELGSLIREMPAGEYRDYLEGKYSS